MSRPISLSARQALFSSGTGEAFLVLLTLDHSSMTAPIRVTSDAVETISRGDSFIAFPFDLLIPDDTENASPRARLIIDNVDRAIVAAIRNITSAPSILIEIVQASNPDTVEASFPDFKLTNVNYDALTVSGDLTVEDFTAEPWPCAIFSPANFPGMF